MACKRSAVRSRLAPPSSKFDQSRRKAAFLSDELASTFVPLSRRRIRSTIGGNRHRSVTAQCQGQLTKRDLREDGMSLLRSTAAAVVIIAATFSSANAAVEIQWWHALTGANND